MSLDRSQALNAAKQYMLQQNVQAAAEIYRRIIEADPTDLTAINTLGDLYVSTGQVQDAIGQFSRVAASYIERGFTRKAIATLKKIIAVDPADLETAIKLADLYAQAGLPSEARQHYLHIAGTLTRKGQTLDALVVYSKVVDLDPWNSSGRIKLGELYLREGMNEQAYETFVTAADQLAAKSENRRALNAYNEALAIKPDSVKVLAATRKILTLLGVADPDRSLPSSGSNSPDPFDLAGENAPAPVALDPPNASASLDTVAQGSDRFVVEEISKAEILVAYGQVNQAISMLGDVLRDNPDSIDVHIKLKDIYLRTGMMTEAAHEYVELERIHDARGESERARDYAVRASRLTQLLEQPSGDLSELTRKHVEEVPPRVDAAPAKLAAPSAPNPRPVVSRIEAHSPQPSRMTFSVIPSVVAALESATMPASDLPPASQSSPVEVLEVGEAVIDSRPSRESVLALSTHPSTDESTRSLPALFASSLPLKKERSRLAAAGVAAAVFVLLGVSAVIGGFAYGAHLDKQYQALSLDAPPLVLPSPPPVLVSDEPPPLQENEPITVVVTPPVQPDPSARGQNPEPELIRNEPLSPSQSRSESPNIATRPLPAPPRAAVSPGSGAGTENRTPVGVPTDVPIGPSHPAEPPPQAVRQSPGVVLGGAVRKVNPVYPTAARDARQAGMVAVEVAINEQGNVTSARAVSGPGLLRNAAVSAAQAWKFKASTLGGVPVPTTTTIVFNFKL